MEKSPRDGLSRELWPIFDLEIALGNEVAYVAEPAGTACPYAVSLQRPLHLQAIFVGTPTRKHCEPLTLPVDVKFWVSRDSHYPIEAGFHSETSGHSIAGPIDESSDFLKSLKSFGGQ